MLDLIYLLGMLALLCAGLLVSHGILWLVRKVLGLPHIDY